MDHKMYVKILNETVAWFLSQMEGDEDEQGVYICRHCSTLFQSAHALSRHLRSEHGAHAQHSSESDEDDAEVSHLMRVSLGDAHGHTHLHPDGFFDDAQDASSGGENGNNCDEDSNLSSSFVGGTGNEKTCFLHTARSVVSEEHCFLVPEKKTWQHGQQHVWQSQVRGKFRSSQSCFPCTNRV